MDTTVFLAQIWGPIILALGIGFFVSRSYYVSLYKDLQKNSLSVLLTAIVGMGVGIAQILVHNVWNTFPEIVVSLLGWGALLKGAVMAIAPGIADKGGDWVASAKLISAIGILLLVLGAYLSWFGYFA